MNLVFETCWSQMSFSARGENSLPSILHRYSEQVQQTKVQMIAGKSGTDIEEYEWSVCDVRKA